MATNHLEKDQPNADAGHLAPHLEQEKKRDSLGYAHDDDATVVVIDDGKTTIPKGTYDPVYEAKARVLNDAVCARLANVCAHFPH